MIPFVLIVLKKCFRFNKEDKMNRKSLTALGTVFLLATAILVSGPAAISEAAGLGSDIIQTENSNGTESGSDGEEDPPETRPENPDVFPQEEFDRLAAKYNPSLDEETKDLIEERIIYYSSYYQVPSKLIISVIAAESEFHPLLKGDLDDTGLMQIRMKYASYWSELMGIEAPETRDDLFDIDRNINTGTYILQRLLGRYDNDLEKTLVAYNAGETYVDRKIRENLALPTSYINRVSRFHTELCSSPLNI